MGLPKSCVLALLILLIIFTSDVNLTNRSPVFPLLTQDHAPRPGAPLMTLAASSASVQGPRPLDAGLLTGRSYAALHGALETGEPNSSYLKSTITYSDGGFNILHFMATSDARHQRQEFPHEWGSSSALAGDGITLQTLATALLPTLFSTKVETSPSGLDSPCCAGTYTLGTSITISVGAVYGFVFRQWLRDGVFWTNQQSFQYTVDGSHTFTAIFLQQFTINVNTDPPGLDNPQGAGTYVAGTQIRISVSDVQGYTFVKWQRDGFDYPNPESFQYAVDGFHTFTAIFIANDFAVSANRGITVTQGYSGSNSITVTLISGLIQSVSLNCPNPPNGVSCRFNPSFGNPPFSSTLTVSTLASTNTGQYSLTITAVGGGISRSTNFGLTVTLRTMQNRIANVTYWLLRQEVPYNQTRTTYAAAVFSADRSKGYTDDNARLAMALTFALEYFKKTQQDTAWCRNQNCPKLQDKIKVAIEFIRASKSSTGSFYHYWDLTQRKWVESGDFSYWDAADLEGLAVVAVKMRWSGLSSQDDYAYYENVMNLVKQTLDTWQPRSQQQDGSWLLLTKPGSKDTELAENGMILAALTLLTYHERSLGNDDFLKYSRLAKATAGWIRNRQDLHPDRTWPWGGGYGGLYNNNDPIVQYPDANARAIFGLVMYGLNMELISTDTTTKPVIADIMKAWLDGFVARTHDPMWGPIHSTTSTDALDYPKETYTAGTMGTAILGGFNFLSDSKYKEWAMNFYRWTTGKNQLELDFQGAIDRIHSQQANGVDQQGFYVGILRDNPNLQMDYDSNVETNSEMLAFMIALEDQSIPWNIGPPLVTPQPSGPTCVIATAAYGSELAAPVQFLREFRDESVNGTYLGSSFLSAFNSWYYSWAPSIAGLEAGNGYLRGAVRIMILPLLGSLIVSESVFRLLHALNQEVAIIVSGLMVSALVGLSYLAPIFFVTLRVIRRRLTARAFLIVAIAGLGLTLIGTLGHGTTSVAANLTASIVIETILFAPVLLIWKLAN